MIGHGAVAILNPRAGGRARLYLPEGVEILETRAPGHATGLARAAIKGGAKTIIAVGGDGTINEVVNGFFEDEQPISAQASLAIIPHGTGSDFRRTLKLPTDHKLAAKIIETGEKRLIDVMKVRYTAAEGNSTAVRYAINLTSFGMGGTVAAKVNRSSKPLGPLFTFLSATLQTVLRFPGNNVTLTLDEARTIAGRITNVAVGNGQYHGAGMWVCPGAIIDDGLLDVTIVQHLQLAELLRNLPILYNGGIYSHPKVQSYRVKKLQADSHETVLVEIDGEAVGRLPVEISVVPRAIPVFFP